VTKDSTGYPDVDKLANLVQEAADLLEKRGEQHWADWFRRVNLLIRNLELRGVEELLSAFGGMGSITDRSWSEKFACLLDNIYDLAWQLRRDELIAQSANKNAK
jgi:hypothetical protein